MSLNLDCNVLITASSVNGPGKCIKSSISTGDCLFVDCIVIFVPFDVAADDDVIVLLLPGLIGKSLKPIDDGCVVVVVLLRRGNVPPQCCDSRKWE